MPTFRLNIVFVGVNFDDDEVFEALAEVPGLAWRSDGQVAVATAILDAPSALHAADLVTKQVMGRVVTARPLRLDDDLVAIPDIASRVGMTREAVRNWANGTRHANFPLPRGVVGDAIKVWAWSDVSVWLRDNLNLGDREGVPSADEVAVINAHFADIRLGQSGTPPTAATWNVATIINASTKTRIFHSTSRPASWVRSDRHTRSFSVVDSGRHAAA